MNKPKRSDDKYWTGTRNFNENQFISDLEDYIFSLEERIEALAIPRVSKSFTYKDISKVAEELANQYSSDKKDPVWRDIRQDGIKAIQAFISKYL